MAIIDTGQLSDDCDKCIQTVSLLKVEWNKARATQKFTLASSIIRNL